MNLLQNEIKLGATKDDKVVITNSRIFQQELKFGSNYHLSIQLEDISSIEMHYKSNPILLVLGILFSLYGLYTILTSYDKTPGFAALFLGIILLLIWWFTRRFAVSIKPNGGKSLDCYFEATTPENIESFLETLEQAKLDRTSQIKSNKNNTNSNVNLNKENHKITNKSNCPSCKNSTNPDDIFCENCGCKLK